LEIGILLIERRFKEQGATLRDCIMDVIFSSLLVFCRLFKAFFPSSACFSGLAALGGFLHWRIVTTGITTS
jgi:hypothetical protein